MQASQRTRGTAHGSKCVWPRSPISEEDWEEVLDDEEEEEEWEEILDEEEDEDSLEEEDLEEHRHAAIPIWRKHVATPQQQMSTDMPRRCEGTAADERRHDAKPSRSRVNPPSYMLRTQNTFYINSDKPIYVIRFDSTAGAYPKQPNFTRANRCF
jgi:hypothetical protein